MRMRILLRCRLPDLCKADVVRHLAFGFRNGLLTSVYRPRRDAITVDLARKHFRDALLLGATFCFDRRLSAFFQER